MVERACTTFEAGWSVGVWVWVHQVSDLCCFATRALSGSAWREGVGDAVWEVASLPRAVLPLEAIAVY